MAIIWNYFLHFVPNRGNCVDIIDGLRAFVATAQTGSFTEAANRMGISNRLTSKYVAELEAHLGVRLLQRTTRRVGLSPAGENLLARAPALLGELDDVLADVSEDSRGHSGVIRISAPITFGEKYVTEMLGRFVAKHPALTLDIRLSDTYTDLAKDGIDVAFRIGATQSLSIKTLKLGNIRVMAAASPAYVARNGEPQSPGDIANHACIVDTNRRSPYLWGYSRNNQDYSVSVKGRFLVNSASAACSLAAAGHGITYSPRFALAEGLANGRLVQLIPDYNGEIIPVSAVYLEGRALPRKVRALIDFAKNDMQRYEVL